MCLCQSTFYILCAQTSVTEMLMVIKWCNLEILLTEIIPCICYVHIAVQCSTDAWQRQYFKFSFSPCRKKILQITKFVSWWPCLSKLCVYLKCWLYLWKPQNRKLCLLSSLSFSTNSFPACDYLKHALPACLLHPVYCKYKSSSC